MASRLIDWTLAHLRLMWAFVGLTLLVMLFIPDARLDVITTVWGALFLGLLISLVLEQRGEGIQMQALISGSTRSVRREAAERARVHIWARVAQTQSTPHSEDNDHMLGYAEQAMEVRERLLGLRHGHRVVLSRVTQLGMALDRLPDTLHWYEEAVAAKDNPWAEDVRAARFFLQPIAEAAVGLSEACADLLFEARLLPR